MEPMAKPRNSNAQALAGTDGAIDAKTAYEQLCTDFRALNTILWQLPVIVTTLTGGLWFAVASFDLTDQARSGLLVFAGLADLIMIAALIRLRYVMETMRGRICAFDGRPSPKGNFFTVGLMSLLLLIVALGSFTASCNPSAWFAKAASHSPDRGRAHGLPARRWLLPAQRDDSRAPL